MPEKYYLGEKSTLIGPFTATELEACYSAGEINGDTLCWPKKLSNVGWKPLSDFFPHFRSPKKEEKERLEREKQEAEREEKARQEKQSREKTWSSDHSISFECVECGKGIRLRLPQTNNTYRCPCCKTEYKTIATNGTQPVLLVVPLLRNPNPESETFSKRKRALPPEILAALAVFELHGEADFEAVRHAYREHVKQYHPDMVAHLGPDLRKLAEDKTKKFNSAYQVLEKYFSS